MREVVMGKGNVINTFDFVFNDKTGIDEAFFNYYYNPSVIRNTEIVYKKPSVEETLSEILIRALSGEGMEIKNKNTSDKPTWFSGSYHPDLGLTVVIVKRHSKKLKPLPSPWQVFYDYASFQEILEDFEPIPTVESYSLVRESEINNNSIALLKLICDYPVWLMDDKIRIKFIEILETARWKPRKERKEALKLLNRHLIPKFKGGKTPVPPGYIFAKELVSELAEYLSKKCKSKTDCNFNIKRGGLLDEDDYKTLVKWARENKEWRISTLSYETLDTLIFRPSIFTQDLIETYFHASIKTFQRNIK